MLINTFNSKTHHILFFTVSPFPILSHEQACVLEACIIIGPSDPVKYAQLNIDKHTKALPIHRYLFHIFLVNMRINSFTASKDFMSHSYFLNKEFITCHFQPTQLLCEAY